MVDRDLKKTQEQSFVHDVRARLNFDQHKNISPVKHLIIKTFNHFIKTYPDFPDFFRVWKIAGQILRLFQELKTLHEPCYLIYKQYNL